MTSLFRLSLAAAALTSIVLQCGCAGARSVQPAGAATELGRPIVIGNSYEIRSKVLGDVRRVNVRLPDHYGEAGRTFPVLFLLDGGVQEDFVHIAGLAQINAAYGQGQELIVVGIEGVDRRHDLTSPSSMDADRKLAPTSGGAAAYRRFLIDELKPWVAARYRANGHSAIIGESLAGLFVLETLLTAPTSFDDYIAVSPSLWWNGGRLSTGAAAQLRKLKFSGQRVWIGFDEPAPPADRAAKERALQDMLDAVFRSGKPKGLDFTVGRLNEAHGSIYHPAALVAFRAFYGTTPVTPK